MRLTSVNQVETVSKINHIQFRQDLSINLFEAAYAVLPYGKLKLIMDSWASLNLHSWWR